MFLRSIPGAQTAELDDDMFESIANPSLHHALLSNTSCATNFAVHPSSRPPRPYLNCYINPISSAGWADNPVALPTVQRRFYLTAHGEIETSSGHILHLRCSACMGIGNRGRRFSIEWSTRDFQPIVSWRARGDRL